MKRIMILSVVLMICLSVFAGCDKKADEGDIKIKKKETNSDSSGDTFADYNPIELKENVQYVLVAKKSKYIVINSEDDFSELKVAYIGGTDGEAYAKYYDFAETGMYNAPNDLHSGISGKDFDVGLIDEEKLSTYDDWEVVWEMKR